jgi:hypothetical protein
MRTGIALDGAPDVEVVVGEERGELSVGCGAREQRPEVGFELGQAWAEEVRGGV